LSRDANKPQLSRFMELAATYPEEEHAFFTALAFNKDVDFYQEGVEKVALLTMHASKGLEFPMVFIAGCEAGLIPYSFFGTAVADLDEERRLFYVAVTRAKERLFLSWSVKRTIFGRSCERKLSPFVASIEQRLKENWRNESNYTQRQKQLSLF
jgi:DNA helicase-2/ATP-dependent DNA helicase PcrA